MSAETRAYLPGPGDPRGPASPGAATLPAIAALLAALLAPLLGGCSAGLHSNAPADQAYVLRPAAGQELGEAARADGRPVLAVSVQVARPLARPGLEGDRIVVLRGDRRLDAYAASRWAGVLPDVMEAFAVDSLRASGRFRGVEDERAPFQADYVLRMTLRHFEAEGSEGAAPGVRVALDCLVARRADRSVVASFTAESVVEASANRMASVVGAFEAAARAALAQAIVGTAHAIEADAGGPLRTSTAPSTP